MARIRTVKPEIAKHELLFQTEQETGFPIRFVWAILPTHCDREGRFKWRPTPMKTDLLPYDDVDFAAVLNALVERDFMVRYRVGSEWYGWIPTFTKHQFINNRESYSELPSPDEADEVIRGGSITSTREPRVPDASRACSSGREGKGSGKEGKGVQPGAVTGSRPKADDSPTVHEYPTVGADGPVYRLSEAQVAEWAGLFPTIDVRQEARGAMAWLLANPGRRKTVGGMPKFLVGWLTRATNSARPSSASVSKQGGSQVRNQPSRSFQSLPLTPAGGRS
jgi:hypothetical protein